MRVKNCPSLGTTMSIKRTDSWNAAGLTLYGLEADFDCKTAVGIQTAVYPVVKDAIINKYCINK